VGDDKGAAKAAWDAEASRKLGAELAQSLEGATGALKAWASDVRRNHETAALAGLYRTLRHLDATGGAPGSAAQVERLLRQEEIRRQLATAIEGYDTGYLADLATFGGWLADAAGKEWQGRTKKSQ
jgi:hypothetical protein